MLRYREGQQQNHAEVLIRRTLVDKGESAGWVLVTRSRCWGSTFCTCRALYRQLAELIQGTNSSSSSSIVTITLTLHHAFTISFRAQNSPFLQIFSTVVS